MVGKPTMISLPVESNEGKLSCSGNPGDNRWIPKFAQTARSPEVCSTVCLSYLLRFLLGVLLMVHVHFGIHPLSDMRVLHRSG